MRKHFYLVIFLILLPVAACSQLFKRYHAHNGQMPPKAILVMLPTAANRINYYIKKGNTKNVQLLLADAATQREHMVADFKDHFTYCPVYFFYDTAQAAINVKDFSYLLNSDMRQAANLVITPADSNYFIVYFGYPEEQRSSKGDANDYNSSFSGFSVKTLAALYPDFTPLSHKLPYKAWPVTITTKRKKEKSATAYAYQSKNFDISYDPYAGLYSHNLTAFYRLKMKPLTDSM